MSIVFGRDAPPILIEVYRRGEWHRFDGPDGFELATTDYGWELSTGGEIVAPPWRVSQGSTLVAAAATRP